MTSLPLVSVVITTKNEEKNIELCLKSIETQTWKNIEIILVDNNSSDNTTGIARKYTTHIYNKGPERSAQRNYGMIHVSSGEYVMYVDADMVLHPDLIERCVRQIIETKSLALYIPEIILGHSFLCQVRRFERSFYDGTVVDCVRFIRKDVFEKIAGFDERINGPEDWDMDRKIRNEGIVGLVNSFPANSLSSAQSWGLYKTIFDLGVDPKKFSGVVYHNESRFQLGSYLKKKNYYSLGFDTYQNKWGTSDPDISKQFGFYYRFFGIFLEAGKWRKLISHPVLGIGMYFLRFLVGFVYILRKTKG